MIYLITGGVRSGKSSYAETLAKHFSQQVLYVATLEPLDQEMQRRIARHQAQRPLGWQTVETSVELVNILKACSREVVLIDCLSGFVSNLVLQYEADGEDIVLQKTLEAVEDLARTLETIDKTIIIVSNEVGYGVVPAYPLGRWFRDALGLANQRIAQVADAVAIVITGIPLVLKGRLPDLK